MRTHRFVTLSLATVLALTLAGAAAVQAHGAAGAAKEKASGPLTGEIVDLGCYLAHEGKGADHASCAAKCISNGMPMGLLTSDGTLYVLTLSHEDADPFNKAKTLAAKTVTITGPVSQRGGLKAIEVDKIEEVAAK